MSQEFLATLWGLKFVETCPPTKTPICKQGPLIQHQHLTSPIPFRPNKHKFPQMYSKI